MDVLTPDIRISKSSRSFSPSQNPMPKMANKPWNAATYVYNFKKYINYIYHKTHSLVILLLIVIIKLILHIFLNINKQNCVC